MAVLIKGMNGLPNGCWNCPCFDNELDECNALGKATTTEDWHKRKADCPLIEIPDVYIDISKAFRTELCNKVCREGKDG